MPAVQTIEDPAPDWTPDPDYAAWSDEQVEQQYLKVQREHQRRAVVKAAAEASEAARETYRAATGIRDGMEWRDPVGFLDAVQPGETRVWDGVLYVNASSQPALQSPGAAPELWEVAPEREAGPVVEDSPPFDEPAPDGEV